VYYARCTRIIGYYTPDSVVTYTYSVTSSREACEVLPSASVRPFSVRVTCGQGSVLLSQDNAMSCSRAKSAILYCLDESICMTEYTANCLPHTYGTK